ncbi:MAG TPA: heavy-metal-associated domain-containing protein, partial [Acidimicrobiales bacterium]|nr:heavy-metal-associated domain-containing protein [Acidimicrobiales bacterium]
MTTTDLPIAGMTCGACAAKIERALNGIGGVDATVNYATQRARVTHDSALVDRQALVAAVEGLGYRVGREPDVAAHTPHIRRMRRQIASDPLRDR